MNIDEYVEEKVNKLIGLFVGGIPAGLSVNKLEDFIRTIIKECQPRVSREFVKRWAESMGSTELEIACHYLIKMLEEAGVEVNNEVFPT